MKMWDYSLSVEKSGPKNLKVVWSLREKEEGRLTNRIYRTYG